MRLALIALVLAACDRQVIERSDHIFGDEPIAIPSDDELQLELTDAIAKKHREDLDRALDAKEPGEQLEHATLSQIALDREVFTKDDMFRVADDLFAYAFRPEQGLGNGLAGRPGFDAGPNAAPNLRRIHRGEFGGPDANSCLDCHFVGGDDGAGTLTQNAYLRGDGDLASSADVRNAPALLGVGPIERLATEMTEELAMQRQTAIAMAQTAGIAVTMPLVAKGLTFGELRAQPDGSLDTSGVRGVSPDLVVRPFGWKGHQATLREMVKESFRIHLGIVSVADQQLVRDGVVPPTLFGDGPWYDVDRDGTTIEVEDGMVTTMVAYLAQLEVPTSRRTDDPDEQAAIERGASAFVDAECASCHRPLRLLSPMLVTRAEQTENTGSPTVSIDVSRDGMTPKILPDEAGYHVALFSDLRRHDMGPELCSPGEQIVGGAPVPRCTWLTRPLWGLADSPPYLHDGRAPTIEAAILAHRGDAQTSRDHFLAMPLATQRALLVFLASLTRTPRVVSL